MQTLSESLSFLQKFYDKRLPEEAAKFYLRDFRNVDEEVFERASKECARNETRFPTVTTLNKYLGVQREREWQTFKRKQTQGKGQEWKNINPVYGKEAWAVIHRVAFVPHGSPEHLCGMALVEEMERMEKKWPGWDWGKEARGFKEWLESEKR